MNDPLLENPRKTKKERVIEALKLLPHPMFPEEKEANDEILKVSKAVGCHRSTVYDGVKELRLQHLIRHYSTNIESPKFEKLKNVTLRSVNRELLDQLLFLYELFERLLKGIVGEGQPQLPSLSERNRLKVIEGLLGLGGDDKNE
jgi:DNA-binding Lrp family transcriptional regulator